MRLVFSVRSVSRGPVTALLVWFSFVAVPPIPDPCKLVSRVEAQGFLSEAIADTVREEPEPDEDSGGVITTCGYLAKTVHFYVTVVEFKSPAEAAGKVTIQFFKARKAAPTVEPEPGLGDRALFGYSAEAVMMVVLKGPRAYAIGLVGAIAKGDAVRHRAAFHKLLAAVAAKG